MHNSWHSLSEKPGYQCSLIQTRKGEIRSRLLRKDAARRIHQTLSVNMAKTDKVGDREYMDQLCGKL